MDPKPRPNHALVIKTLRRMAPEERLAAALELSEHSRALFEAGLRARYPTLSETEFHRVYLRRLAKCHNRSY